MQKKLISKIIRKVFPANSTVVWNADEVIPEERFWVIGSKKGPRWIIPQNPNLSVSILQQWRPYGAFSCLKWRFLLAAYCAGQLHRLPGIVSIGVSGATANNWKHFGGTEQQRFIPIIYIGTPSLTRKAIVSLVDKASFKWVGIAKVPLESQAVDNILREAETLTRLESEKPDLAPQSLFIDREQGIAVQTPLTGKPTTNTSLTKSHLEWLSRLYISGKQTSLQEQTDKLKQRLGALNGIDREMKTLVSKLLETLEDPTLLPCTWVHGDFTPWNIKWSDSRKLVVVDWEEARPKSLPLQDLFHYQYIQSCFLKPNKNLLDETWKKPIVIEYLQSWGIDRSRYEKLAQFYLAEECIRRLEKDDHDYAAFLVAEISQIDFLNKKRAFCK